MENNDESTLHNSWIQSLFSWILFCFFRFLSFFFQFISIFSRALSHTRLRSQMYTWQKKRSSSTPPSPPSSSSPSSPFAYREERKQRYSRTSRALFLLLLLSLSLLLYFFLFHSSDASEGSSQAPIQVKADVRSREREQDREREERETEQRRRTSAVDAARTHNEWQQNQQADPQSQEEESAANEEEREREANGDQSATSPNGDAAAPPHDALYRIFLQKEKCRGLIENLRSMKQSGTVMEEDNAALRKISELQFELRSLFAMRFRDPNKVLVELVFQFPETAEEREREREEELREQTRKKWRSRLRGDRAAAEELPDMEREEREGRILVELVGSDVSPYTLFYFLELVQFWESAAMRRRAGHVLQALSLSHTHTYTHTFSLTSLTHTRTHAFTRSRTLCCLFLSLSFHPSSSLSLYVCGCVSSYRLSLPCLYLKHHLSSLSILFTLSLRISFSLLLSLCPCVY